MPIGCTDCVTVSEISQASSVTHIAFDRWRAPSLEIEPMFLAQFWFRKRLDLPTVCRSRPSHQVQTDCPTHYSRNYLDQSYTGPSKLDHVLSTEVQVAGSLTLD